MADKKPGDKKKEVKKEEIKPSTPITSIKPITSTTPSKSSMPSKPTEPTEPFMPGTAKKPSPIKMPKISKGIFIAASIIVIVAALMIISLTFFDEPASEEEPPEVQEIPQTEPEPEPEPKMVDTEIKEILKAMTIDDVPEGWKFSGVERELVAASGISDGARISMCNGVDECKVQWWGTPMKAAKLMATVSRFYQISSAQTYYDSLFKEGGTQVEENCFLYDDYSALCMRYNVAFFVEAEYGSTYDENLMPPLEYLVLKIHQELDYWT